MLDQGDHADSREGAMGVARPVGAKEVGELRSRRGLVARSPRSAMSRAQQEEKRVQPALVILV